jgi:hypothetical protein
MCAAIGANLENAVTRFDEPGEHPAVQLERHPCSRRLDETVPLAFAQSDEMSPNEVEGIFGVLHDSRMLVEGSEGWELFAWSVLEALAAADTGGALYRRLGSYAGL